MVDSDACAILDFMICPVVDKLESWRFTWQTALCALEPHYPERRTEVEVPKICSLQKTFLANMCFIEKTHYICHDKMIGIKEGDRGYVAADDIDNATFRKIPLWAFGFLY